MVVSFTSNERMHWTSDYRSNTMLTNVTNAKDNLVFQIYIDSYKSLIQQRRLNQTLSCYRNNIKKLCQRRKKTRSFVRHNEIPTLRIVVNGEDLTIARKTNKRVFTNILRALNGRIH